MAIKVWQSVCISCGLVYKVQLIEVQESKYNTSCFSTGVCPECQEKRKERRRQWMENFVNGKEK